MTKSEIKLKCFPLILNHMKKLKLSIITSILLASLTFSSLSKANETAIFDSAYNIVYNDINVPTPQNEEGSKFNVKNLKDIVYNVLSKSLLYIGTPYKWGGTTENGFDCSGFVKFVYEHSIGLTLPRTSKEMSEVGTIVKNFKELMPGDLVFFNTRRFNFSHVGIYLGDNKFIHAPRKGQKVRVEEIDDSYWTKRFNGARRIL